MLGAHPVSPSLYGFFTCETHPCDRRAPTSRSPDRMVFGHEWFLRCSMRFPAFHRFAALMIATRIRGVGGDYSTTSDVIPAVLLDVA